MVKESIRIQKNLKKKLETYVRTKNIKTDFDYNV